MMAASLKTTCGDMPDPGTLLSPLALSMARSAAIRRGRILTTEEMETLVADLFRTGEPDHTPDGLTIVAPIGTETISALFD